MNGEAGGARSRQGHTFRPSVFNLTEGAAVNISVSLFRFRLDLIKLKLKLHGLSPRANYTDRATAACRRSDCQLFRIEGATWSA
jgi:hypothetical protein